MRRDGLHPWLLGLALLSGCALFGLDVDDEEGDDESGDGINGANAIDCSATPRLYLGSPQSAYLDSGASSQACGSLGGSSHEHVYLFYPSQSGSYRFSLAASFDAVLYLIENPCTTSALPATSVECTDQSGGSESVETFLPANGPPVAVVVDGFYSAVGSYQLVAELIGESTNESCRQPCTSNADCGLGDYPEACLATTAGTICVAAGCEACFANDLSCLSDSMTCEFLECTTSP
jgi:hypothetical protein